MAVLLSVAATVLATLGDMLGLGWALEDIFARTTALEQLLTSGGGWQDQIGGLCKGVKLIQTEPGFAQKPTIRGLPASLFEASEAGDRLLLYYTGITRIAHDILGSIVRGLFLNAAAHLSIIDEIGRNAGFAADAIQRQSWDDLCLAVRRSWRLNQLLDAGTNPPPVQEIITRMGDDIVACKLLGAGGGGYMLALARDAAAAAAVRDRLTDDPPNDRARFVDVSVSTTGLQVTRS